MIPGFRLVSQSYFPYALPDEDQSSVGEIIVFDNEQDYLNARNRMDRLEGVPNFYKRVVVEVITANGTCDAWLYTPADPEDYEHLPEVHANDWCYCS